MHGGELVAEVLRAQGTPFLFTLVGGHISPILVAARQRDIRVIDTRHEATAVFAADAVARLTGRPGVAAVTAGPGVTNTITALKNAQMAQSPVVLIGGAAPTALQGRGALQDIDQMAAVRPVVKWAQRVSRVKELTPVLETAFRKAQTGVPGPVFVECPVDLLYDEATVRTWYGADRGGRSVADRALKHYLRFHVNRLFSGAQNAKAGPRIDVASLAPSPALVSKVAERLHRARRPVILVGSQALLDVAHAHDLAAALHTIGAPVYLSGMARGLLGRDHPLQLRHKRREALREADCVLLAGVPCDFRLDYGNHIRRSATLISINRSPTDLVKNRKPDIGLLADPSLTLRTLAATLPPAPRPASWSTWLAQLRTRDDARNAEIARQSLAPTGNINPLHLCMEIDRQVTPNTILIGDGGDFVATASYIVQPPGPLRWLDPGAFGTLGVGAGFALGAKLVHPDAEVWVLFGDGAFGYSATEFDTFVRHRLPVLAVIGNDASWSQIAREQVEMLGDPVATELAYSDYDRMAQGLGAAGVRLDDPELTAEMLAQARELAAHGQPVVVNAIVGKTEFRKGSISM
ncbi:MAG TPA: acetolactate synthase [Chloroflexi bacterium]|nr:acetolactate synthase [Chloroflexota bacterium]HHW88086.1 thiamine pyrophosphate-binding protein [Chloroflexota bacterium]